MKKPRPFSVGVFSFGFYIFVPKGMRKAFNIFSAAAVIIMMMVATSMPHHHQAEGGEDCPVQILKQGLDFRNGSQLDFVFFAAVLPSRQPACIVPQTGLELYHTEKVSIDPLYLAGCISLRAPPAQA